MHVVPEAVELSVTPLPLKPGRYQSAGGLILATYRGPVRKAQRMSPPRYVSDEEIFSVVECVGGLWIGASVGVDQHGSVEVI